MNCNYEPFCRDRDEQGDLWFIFRPTHSQSPTITEFILLRSTASNARLLCVSSSAPSYSSIRALEPLGCLLRPTQRDWGSKGISTQLHCTAHFDLSATTRIELVELMGTTNTKHLYYARVTGHYWSRATMTPIFSANEPTKPISAAFCESLFEEFSENAYTVFRQQSWSSVLVCM